MGRITLDMTGQDAIIAMAEGNPGALTVCIGLCKDELGLIDLCHLDDMKLYGPNIWLGYKDICGQDIDKFREMVRNRTIGDEVRKLPYFKESYR